MNNKYKRVNIIKCREIPVEKKSNVLVLICACKLGTFHYDNLPLILHLFSLHTNLLSHCFNGCIRQIVTFICILIKR